MKNRPVGIATQNPELRKRFDIAKSVERFENICSLTKEELENFARINGRTDVHRLDLTDVLTLSNEVSMNTDIEHV